MKNDIKEMASKLSLQEKIGMIHGNSFFTTKGIERRNIPPFVFSDGPCGCRFEYGADEWIPRGYSNDYSLYMPSNMAIAATWNEEMAYAAGKSLGCEARRRGKDMILAPGVNIMRNPLCGRNFEYMGEDPYLSSRMAVPMVTGIEENDVASCLKHFAANNQEYKRMTIDVQVDERTLQEIYFPAFKAAITKGGAKGVMGAYNKINGKHCCHNPQLDKVLRKDWGFDGIYVSDWGGVHDTIEAAYSTLDIEMGVKPEFDEMYMADPLEAAVSEGNVLQEQIDEKVEHILNVMDKLHMLDGKREKAEYDVMKLQQNMSDVADESVVLLKNELSEGEKLLPVKGDSKILLIGDNADRLHASYGGSAEIKALYEISPYLGFTIKAGGDNVEYVPGYCANVVGSAWAEIPELAQSDCTTASMQNILEPEERLFSEAVEAAREAYEKSHTVIYIGGLNHDYDLEGRDRKDMTLPYHQDKLINMLLDVCPDMIVVMISGAPVDMSAWIDRVHALVWMSYNGMCGGLSLAKNILGEVNPSGKLPFTFPKKLESTPCVKYDSLGDEERVEYKEKLDVGYRYYDKHKEDVQFCFGYGMSYTDFAIRNVEAEHIEGTKYRLHMNVKNTGTQKGKEVIQVYVHEVNPVAVRPYKELKGFCKVALSAGEEQDIVMDLEEEIFSYYNEEKGKFVCQGGEYELLIGNSCDNILETVKIVI